MTDVAEIARYCREFYRMTSTDTQEESMKLGGGTANGMRALGYQVLPPEPNSDSTCWRMIAPQDRNTEYLAADQAEGWCKAEMHWHARNLENVVRRTPPTPATDTPGTYGTMTPTIEVVPPHYPLAADEREAVARAERAERSGVLIALWAEYRAQSSEKLPVTIDDAHSRHRYLVSAFADAALSALRETRAAEILAAEARGYAKAIEDAANVVSNKGHTGLPYSTVAAIRALRNEHGAGK